jgi:hypothetical protein
MGIRILPGFEKSSFKAKKGLTKGSGVRIL